MKFSRILTIAALAAVTLLTSCEKEEQLGAAKITVDPAEVTLSFEAGASATVGLTATREWTVNGAPDWLTVTPDNGKGSNKKQKITLTAKSNPDIERSANITFTIGFSDAVLKVKQEGEAGSLEESLLYKNDFDKAEVAKVNDSWPYLDQTECWKNESGNGIANVSYEFKTMSVRNSGKLSDDQSGYSLYAGSGHNKLFFGKQALFAVKNIALGGKTNLAVSFGGQRYGQDDKDNTFNHEEFKVYVSIDGIKGVDVPYTFATVADGVAVDPVGNWDLATAKFSVPAGTENLTVVFKIPAALQNNVYSIDDVQVAAASGGQALDFTNAVSLGLDQSGNIPDSDEVTDLATIVAKTPGSAVTVLNATVTAVNTKAYVISDGTTSIYVYKNADPKLAVGDKVSIIGTFKYYWGEYEIVDSSEKKTGTATPVYGTPTEITKDFLTRCAAAAPEEEESTGYNGPWYPIYAHASATVHKDGNYTQFKVEGYDGYMSLVSAPSAMFADETGTSWGEGNAVELFGYYTGWESKNEYHQFVAVSVTGQATYTPVEAAVAGDDVFIAANVAHDQKVANGTAFTNPIVVGDASFSFLGGGNNGKYYDAGTAARMYNAGSLKIESSRPIVKVEYLFAPKDNNGTYNPVEADLSKLFTVGSCTFDDTKNILTWTGTAKEIVLTYPLTTGNYRFQQVGVTYGEDVEARLSVVPDAISVKAVETSAKFNVQSNVAWAIASDNNSFVATPASGEGNAEVTVAFPANESFDNEVVAHLTVSANGCDDVKVTITQAKKIDENAVTDLSEILKSADNTAVEIRNVIVSAVENKNYIVTDGVTPLYINANSTSHGMKVGDKVNVNGTFKWYYGLAEIASPTATVLSSNNDVLYGEALDITGAAINAYETQSNSYPFYAKFKGTLGVNGNYYQFTMDGANTYVSLSNLSDANKALFTDGETATVYGYYTGYQSKNKFHQFVFVSKESTGEVTPIFKVDKNAVDVAASSTTHTIALTANMAWTAAISGEGAQFLKGDGTFATTLSGESSASVHVSFPANESTESTKTYTVTFKATDMEDIVVTITQAKKVVLAGGSWVRVTSVDAIKAGGKFILGYEATANSGVIVPLRSDAAAAKTSANGILYSGTAGGTTSDSGTINMATVTETTNYEVTISASTTVDGAVDIKLAIGFVGAPGSKNTARLYESAGANTAYGITAKDNDTFEFLCAAAKESTYCYLQYNTGSPRFANYTGGQKNPVLYKFVEE